MVDYYPRRSRLIFQVDVFPAHGRVPTNLAEVTERQLLQNFALKSTLERLIDFDRINHAKEMRMGDRQPSLTYLQRFQPGQA